MQMHPPSTGLVPCSNNSLWSKRGDTLWLWLATWVPLWWPLGQSNRAICACFAANHDGSHEQQQQQDQQEP